MPEFVELTDETWPLFEQLFGPGGAQGGCWCSFFRLSVDEFKRAGAEGRKAHTREEIAQGYPRGLLAVVDGVALGWVAVSPKPDNPRLARSPIASATAEFDEAGDVWSVTCFFVHKLARGNTLATAMLNAAVQYAAGMGAAVLEGYPVDVPETRPDGDLYRGTVGMFADAGFDVVERRGPGRALMRLRVTADMLHPIGHYSPPAGTQAAGPASNLLPPARPAAPTEPEDGVSDVVAQQPQADLVPDGADLSTGPIAVPARYGGLLGGDPNYGGFDDAPTPPSGYFARPALPESWPRAVSPLLPPVPLVPPPPAAPAPTAAAPPPSNPPVPQPKPAQGSVRTERQSVVALFLVHMFPIGHLPVAMNRPARQLPLPALAAASGPYEHPDFDLIDDVEALAHVTSGFQRSPAATPLPVPLEMTTGYDELGGMTPYEWDSRFLAAVTDTGREYEWPASELFPEGGLAAGEAVVLDSGVLIDRFGTPHGRVFSGEGTPFARRSLPPAQLGEGYRRYRVARPVPMWRSASAGWFGQEGGGTRYRALLSADELVTLGFLAEVTGESR